jgi:general secretion pathway protein M
MKQWFIELSERERWMVLAAGALTLYAVLHLAVFAPLWGGSARLSEQVNDHRAVLAELRMAEAAVTAQRGDSRPAPVQDAAQSLVVIVDRTSREAGLGGALRRNQPTPDQGLRVNFEAASFDAMIAWLVVLQGRYGITVESASFDGASAPGLVNATLVLERRP